MPKRLGHAVKLDGSQFYLLLAPLLFSCTYCVAISKIAFHLMRVWTRQSPFNDRNLRNTTSDSAFMLDLSQGRDPKFDKPKVTLLI